jgi:hypothetical protein
MAAGDADGLAGLPGEVDDVPGVAVPAGFAASHQMVEAGQIRLLPALRMACAVTSASRFGAGRRADLIGDHL